MSNGIISILEQVKEHITDDSDMVWTGYNSAKELRDELDTYIQQLTENDTACLEKLHGHFLPTSNFQEHSLSNGWADAYLRLVEQFDANYALLQKPKTLGEE